MGVRSKQETIMANNNFVDLIRPYSLSMLIFKSPKSLQYFTSENLISGNKYTLFTVLEKYLPEAIGLGLFMRPRVNIVPYGPTKNSK